MPARRTLLQSLSIVSTVAILASGCDVQTVCCDDGTGTNHHVVSGTCAGTVVATNRCPRNVSASPGITSTCQAFCEGIVAACPATLNCFGTCVTAENGLQPDPPAIDCANASTDCVGAATCWSWSSDVFPPANFPPTIP